MFSDMKKRPYFVRADYQRSALNRERYLDYSVRSYSVWREAMSGEKEQLIKTFSVRRLGGWRLALEYANSLRDKLNSEANRSENNV